jgi:HK97 family phage portal protein
LIPGRGAADYGPLADFWYNPVGSVSSAGIAVKPDNALAVSTVFACIRLLGEGLGSLPWRVHKRDAADSRRKELALDHYLWPTLHDRPNRWQTPIEWREMVVAHICLRGNSYNRIIVNEVGETELIPLNPDRVKVEQLPNRYLRYVWQPQNGEKQTLGPGDVFHIRGLTLDGITGVSVLEFARNAVGSAIAQETHGAALFKNGGLPTFWIKRPRESGKFTPDARRNFRAGWRKLHGGAENAGNPPILEDGMELHELGLTNRDSQWIESRAVQAEEICRFFRVNPHLVGLRAAEAVGTVEQQSIEFVVYTLSPWAVRLEQAANRDLLDDPKTYYTKIALDGLLRGDMLSRYQAHNVAIQGGWELVNEAREKEDRNPIEGGDTPRYPSNMQPAGGGPDWNEQGGQPGKGKPQAKPKQEDQASGDEEDESPTAYERRRKEKAEAAFGPLLEDAAGRIAAMEIRGLARRADKAAEDRTRWNQWAAGIYDGVADCTRRILAPIASAWLGATGETIDVAAIAAEIIRAANPIFDAADVSTVLTRWETTRPAEVLTILRKGFFDA